MRFYSLRVSTFNGDKEEELLFYADTRIMQVDFASSCRV
jgi:hypothetical protein